MKAKHSRIVIAVVENELAVKRLYRRGSQIEFYPENPAVPVIALDNDRRLVICGVVSGVARKRSEVKAHRPGRLQWMLCRLRAVVLSCLVEQAFGRLIE